MAKREKTPRQPNRRHVSRMEREHRQRRYLLIGAGVVFGVILLLLAWGLTDTLLLKPARPVATVGEEKIRTDAYQHLLAYRRYDTYMYLQSLQQQRAQYASTQGLEAFVGYLDQQINGLKQTYAELPVTVLDQMIRDVVVRREAANRGITVTEQEVQTFLEKQFGFDRTAAAAAEVVATLQAETTATPLPTVALAPSIGVTATEGLTEGVELGPTATPVPTAVPMTEDEFAQASAKFFESIKQGVNMSEADFRHLLESALYQEKVETALKAEMPTTAEQVHARHILVATEEEANQVRERLAAGESFEELAKELSTDTGSGAAGGDLGWFVRGQMVEPFEEVAFSLAPGTISEPVQSQYGYHIIEVLAHEQNRSLEGSALQASQQAQLEAWYAERTGPDQVTRSWTPDVVPADPYTLQ